MIRVERKCAKCEGRWWLGDFDEQKYNIFHVYLPHGHCTFCGNRWEFNLILTVLEEKGKEDVPI